MVKGDSVRPQSSFSGLSAPKLTALPVSASGAVSGLRNCGSAVSVMRPTPWRGVAKAAQPPCQRMAAVHGVRALLCFWRALPLSIRALFRTLPSHDARRPSPASWTSRPMSAGAPPCPAWRRSDQALLQRKPARAQRQRRWKRWPRPSHDLQHLSRRQRPASCARPSAKSMAWTRPASWRRGDGSDALLTMLANAYLQARRRSAVQRARLPRLQDRHSGQQRRAGGRARSTNLRFDVDAMLAAVTPTRRASLFIANPNNPTGSYISHEEMRRLHAGLPRACAAGDRRGL